MNSDRIKEIQSQTAYPDSHSVADALRHVWYEAQLKEDCKKCYFTYTNSNESLCRQCSDNPEVKSKFKPKPKIKKIDLSCLVSSDIDMEYAPNASAGTNLSTTDWFVTKLIKVPEGYNAREDTAWIYVNSSPKWIHSKFIRIRQHHWNHWNGRDCPLPKGLKIEILHREGSSSIRSDYINLTGWEVDGNLLDIIAFKVLGVADGWKY